MCQGAPHPWTILISTASRHFIRTNWSWDHPCTSDQFSKLVGASRTELLCAAEEMGEIGFYPAKARYSARPLGAEGGTMWKSITCYRQSMGLAQVQRRGINPNLRVGGPELWTNRRTRRRRYDVLQTFPELFTCPGVRERSSSLSRTPPRCRPWQTTLMTCSGGYV
jgi:hypothetical protein